MLHPAGVVLDHLRGDALEIGQGGVEQVGGGRGGVHDQLLVVMR